MNTTTQSVVPATAVPGEPQAYRPDSASIIHAVINRRGGAPAILDREAAQREQTERANLGLLLHALHEIAEARVPSGLRRLIKESEVQRAAAVLRRFSLLHPTVSYGQLLEHCERATVAEHDPVAHLVDPLQLRHVLTFHEGIPHEELTAIDLYELDRAIEHGPESAVAAWFANVDPQRRALPGATPAYLRTLYFRAARAGVPAARLGTLSFETAVLTLRLQGVIGFEDTRLFFSLLKQIAGEDIPGLESHLESGETHHAAAQHRAAGNTRPAEYFRQLANYFDHTALPNLEQRVVHTAAERSIASQPAAHTPPPVAATASAPVRRGFLSGLFGLGQSLFARS